MLQQEIIEILRDELEQLRQRIGENMAAADQIVTGKTRDSLTVTVSPQAEGAYGVLTGRQAFATLERGSRPWSKRPAKVPRFFADIIGEWLAARGLSDKLNQWAVARTIIDRGSSLYRSGGRDDIYTPELERTMENLGNRVVEYYSVLITDRLNFNTHIDL
jgi:hypothetical protein